MMQGVIISSEEKDEIKRKIVDYLSVGYGRTLYGACQTNDIAVSTVYVWRNEDKSFDDAVILARRIGNESALDIAENGCMKLLAKEDPKTIRWFLDKKGKDRGYVTRSEVTGANGAPLAQATPKATEEEGLAAVQELLRRAP